MAREQWGSRIGVILAVAGSAVGLGNFLRFPGQAAQNGGGAFMLPYFISLLVLGIPLCWAEWTIGRYAGIRGFNSAPGIFSATWRHPLSKYLGALAVIVPLIIYMYYVVIEAWCLGYAWHYLTGELMLGPDPKKYGEFFDSYVGSGSDGFLYDGGQGRVLWFILITFTLNFFLIYRGVTKGIERFCTYAMPLMAVLAVIVLVRVLTLGAPDPASPERSVWNGLGEMWNPSREKLGNAKTWLAAAGQIFFSLSVGFGVIINYASYLKRKDDLALSGLTACSMNEFFEVCLGGMITLPAAFIFLGVTAETFGTYGTFGLGFNALPNVFAQMPGGRFFGAMWFLMLFLAAITSSLSMLQPVIAFLEEGFALKRRASVAILGLISAFGSGFVVYFSKGLVALDTLDFWVGTFLIFFLGLVESLLYGWCFGIEKGHRELHEGALIRVPWFVQLVLKYVVPAYLLVIFGAFCWQSVLSHDVHRFDLPGVSAKDLPAGPVTAAFRDAFARAATAQATEDGDATKALALPETATLERPASGGDWRIVGAKQELLFLVTDREGRAGIATHEAGYLEKIPQDKVAALSIGLIVVVAAFFTLLVHVARAKWDVIPEQPLAE